MPTPVWFGLRDGRAYVRTIADAGKVRRLRRDPHVRIGPCNVRGSPTGAFAEGVGRVLRPEEHELAESALRANYGWGRRLYEGISGRLGVESLYLEIALARAAESAAPTPPTAPTPDAAARPEAGLAVWRRRKVVGRRGEKPIDLVVVVRITRRV